ncbi:copper resistance CopC/CopD family protein [Nocardioides nitrophenolicus]|uniref:copper resistance CopC/CopD family protein n=1 Tax=Nocardioides nitrophenolicus TaxID=60489 RepID=UPI0019564F98|nr:CopD family protein [Nocardioides nitrophenolicus]MBM7516689.1 copper transport protein [Nocardioides nitrophenolicus]
MSGRRAARCASALVVLLAVLWPVTAQAHARPIGTLPADGQVVATAPEVLTVSFDEPVALAPEGNRLLAADGSEVPARFAVRDRLLTVTPEAPLADGTHVVAWRVVSTDSHPVAGGFTFSVGAASASAPAVPVAPEQREVRLAQAVATTLQYAGVLGLAGLACVAILLAPVGLRRHPPVALAWRRAAVALAGLGGLGAALGVPLAAVWESGRPLDAVLTGATWATAARSSTTLAALIVIGAALVAVLGLRSTRRGADGVALAAAAVALSALVLVGHTRSYGPVWVVLGADLVHLAAAALWWGGLVAVGLALGVRPRARAALRAGLVARFSTAAAGSVVALVVAGVALYWRIGHSLGGLVDSGYGRTILLKSALVLPVLGLAAWNRWWLLPRTVRSDESRALGLLTQTVRVEALVLACVLAASGALVQQTPPARAEQPAVHPPTERRIELDLDDGLRASVVLAPGRTGVNGVRVRVVDDAGAPVALDDPPALSFRLPDADLGPLRRPVSDAAGTWEATVDLALSGTWEVALAVPLSPFEQPVVTGRIEVR